MFASRGKLVEVARQDIREHFHAERAPRNIRKSHPHGFCFYFGVTVKQAPDLRENETQMVGLGLGTQAETRLKQNFVAAAEVLEVNCRHGAVGNGQQRPLVRANPGGAQTDVFNDARTIPKPADITDAKDFVAQDGDAAKKILDSLLRTEADGDAANAESCKRRAHIEAKITEHGQDSRYKNDGLKNAFAKP